MFIFLFSRSAETECPCLHKYHCIKAELTDNHSSMSLVKCTICEMKNMKNANILKFVHRCRLDKKD